MKKFLENKVAVGFALGLLALHGNAFALPWEGPLEIIQDSLTGPVAKGVSIIIVVVTGLMIGFGEAGGAGRLMLKLIMGIGLALGAASLIAELF